MLWDNDSSGSMSPTNASGGVVAWIDGRIILYHGLQERVVASGADG